MAGGIGDVTGEGSRGHGKLDIQKRIYSFVQEPRTKTTRERSDEGTGESRLLELGLHGLTGEHVLNVGYGAGGVHKRATREDSEALFRAVQHLLDIWHDAGDIGRDEWIL